MRLTCGSNASRLHAACHTPRQTPSTASSSRLVRGVLTGQANRAPELPSSRKCQPSARISFRVRMDRPDVFDGSAEGVFVAPRGSAWAMVAWMRFAKKQESRHSRRRQ